MGRLGRDDAAPSGRHAGGTPGYLHPVIPKLIRRVDQFQQRHAWLGFPLAVVKKFGDDQAGKQAALIAYYGFFSLFPLLLVFVTILGFVLHGNVELQHRVINSVKDNFPFGATSTRPNPSPPGLPAACSSHGMLIVYRPRYGEGLVAV